MKQYIRFGFIPENERSKNFLNGGKLEAGVSVFDMDGDVPLIQNDAQLENLSCRTVEIFRDKSRNSWFYDSAEDEAAKNAMHIVTGDEVGRGCAGEPLINSVKIVSEYKPSFEEINACMDRYLEETHNKRRDASDETEKSTGVYTHYETYCRCPDCHEVFAEFSESCSCGKQMAEEINKVGFYLFNGKEFIESFK